jgi:hypothetical protein
MAPTSPLHITNADADAKKVGEILGEDTLPWRDFLHDGPVRPGLLLEELSLMRPGSSLASDTGRTTRSWLPSRTATLALRTR